MYVICGANSRRLGAPPPCHPHVLDVRDARERMRNVRFLFFKSFYYYALARARVRRSAPRGLYYAAPCAVCVSVWGAWHAPNVRGMRIGTVVWLGVCLAKATRAALARAHRAHLVHSAVRYTYVVYVHYIIHTIPCVRFFVYVLCVAHPARARARCA